MLRGFLFFSFGPAQGGLQMHGARKRFNGRDFQKCESKYYFEYRAGQQLTIQPEYKVNDIVLLHHDYGWGTIVGVETALNGDVFYRVKTTGFGTMSVAPGMINPDGSGNIDKPKFTIHQHVWYDDDHGIVVNVSERDRQTGKFNYSVRWCMPAGMLGKKNTTTVWESDLMTDAEHLKLELEEIAEEHSV